MRKMIRMIMVVLCVILLCAAVAGCDPSAVNDPTKTPNQLGAGTTVPTQTTMPSTAPTQPDDGSRTLLLTTQGGLAFSNVQITVYEDAELTKQLTVVRTDENGMATFQVEPGKICYAVLGDMFGYVEEPSYVLSAPMTHIRLACDLVDPEFRRNLKVGDIMYDLDLTDWNGNPYRLADAMEAGRHSILVQMRDVSNVGDKVLVWLQQVYEAYGDQLDVVLLCTPDGVGELKAKVEKLGLTYPVVTVHINKDWVYSSHVTVVDRYGMLVFENYLGQTDQDTVNAMVKYFTAEDYQQRLFANFAELLNYMDSLVAGEQVTYRIRFVDEDGLPMENLCVKLKNEQAYTDADGYAQWEVPKRYGYSVELEDMPEEYVTQYDIPYDTWELTIVVIKMHDYTVRVVDTQGNPIPNVGCRLYGEDDDWSGRTDENGWVTWQKFRGTYFVGCSVRVGRDQVGTRQYFPEGQTEMTIVLDLTASVYPMQVVDQDGQPLKGSYIQIKTGNEAIAWDVTDENGMIYWELASAPVYVEYCTEYDLFGGDFIRYEAVGYAWPEGESAMTLVWENKLVTYQIRLVDANGAPVTDVYVWIHPESGLNRECDIDESGVVVFQSWERNYEVTIVYGNLYIEYGVFEFAADDTEVTIVVEIPEE